LTFIKVSQRVAQYDLIPDKRVRLSLMFGGSDPWKKLMKPIITKVFILAWIRILIMEKPGVGDMSSKAAATIVYLHYVAQLL
jgi:hypothetical protein